MKIHHRLALLLLTASLAACGSQDLGGTKGDPLTSTGVVITSTPITTPPTADKATVGFRVTFPEPAGAVKAALNPAMTRVTITTSGGCGVASLELSPTTTSGVMSLKAGDCTFVAAAYDAANAQIESVATKGTLLAGANNVSLTFLGGPWLFVDPATNAKLPISLVGGEILSGMSINTTYGTLLTRWFGPDTLGDGPSSDDILGGLLSTPPQLRASGSFSGGTGAGANLVQLAGATTNLTDWERTYTTGQRDIQILGVNPYASYQKAFVPTTYTDYFTSKVIDGTTLEGNIAEFTVTASNVGAPYGTCTGGTVTPARAAALTAALGTVRKATATSLGTVTASWTECVNYVNQDVTETYSNVTIHPFRAESSFADPASTLQVELNNAIANYKKALETEDASNGLDLTLLRQAASQFVNAVNLAGDNLSNTADTARFFGAISRLASLAVDTAADGVPDGLNDFNDVLDALGVPLDATSRNWSKMMKTPENCVEVMVPYYHLDCTPNLPATAPRSGEILTLLDSKLNTQLDLAIVDLSGISAGFSYDFVEPSGAVTNFDYGDVLALTAIAHGIKAELAIDMAYDLDLDIDATINGSGPASVQQFMLDNPTLGSLDASGYATELTQAKIDLQTALTTMQSAIDEIEAEGTGVAQDLEFISFYNVDYQCIPNQTGIPPYCTWTTIDRTVQNIADFRDGISKALTGLNGPVTVDDNGTPANTADDSIIDPSKFFAGISFRALLPGFTGDEANGFFPDASMGGVLVQTPNMNINQDFNGNGVTDLLEEPKFYNALLSGKAYSLMGYTYNGSIWMKGMYDVNWSSIRFNNDMTVAADWNYNDYSTYPYGTVSGTATGTWSILTTGELQIIFSANPLNLASIVVELDRQVNAQVTPLYFDAGITFTYSDATLMDRNYTRWNEKASISLIIR